MSIDGNKILGVIGLFGLVVSAFSSNPIVRVLAYVGLIFNAWCWR